MAIETALVAPVLILMAVGSFQISSLVARQTELQSAAAEGAAIGLAAPPESQADLNTVRDIMKASTGLGNEDVTVSMVYRCGNATARVTDPTSCGSGVKVWTYMNIRLQTTYSPIWSKFGIGSDISLDVDRAVQIS
ncbi:hypothetical protein GCM10011371_05930 [Novosphingobium marinum]|nr:hypothetical protein GCM10011371_05930 [Novosphingobium marinum]